MRQHNRPFLIGLTGGIASGKSLVCSYLEHKGYHVIYTDLLTHQVLEFDSVKNQLIAKFGKFILEENKISRLKLGEIVFKNKDKRLLLNSIVHPEIRKLIQKDIEYSEDEYLIIEIPLLFESKLEKAFDLTVNIYTNDNIRYERLRKRDKLTSVGVQDRLLSQMNNEEKIKRADINIANNGSIEQLKIKIDEVFSAIDIFPYKKILPFNEI